MTDQGASNTRFSVVGTAVGWPRVRATAGSIAARFVGGALDIAAGRPASQPVVLGVPADAVVTYRSGGWSRAIVRIGVNSLAKGVGHTVAMACFRLRIADRAIPAVFARANRAITPTLVVVEVAGGCIDIGAHLTQITNNQGVLGRVAAETEVVGGVGRE